MPVRVYNLIAGPEWRGVRLDKAVARLLPHLSRKLVQRVVEAGGCFLAGGRCHVPSTLLDEGARVRVCVDPGAYFRRFQLREGDILFESGRVMAVNKPSGVPVNLSATGQEGSVQRGVAEYFRSFGAGHHPSVVHRLDAGTSGIVLFGKDKEAERSLCAAFRERRVEKTYWALVSPSPCEGAEDVVRTRIARRTDRRNQYAVRRERGKEAETRYRVMGVSGAVGLLEVRPETGRPHQIRVHLSWKGFPVVGDVLYGGVSHQALFGLHARRVAIRDVEGVGTLEVAAPPPAEWFQAAGDLVRGALGGTF